MRRNGRLRRYSSKPNRAAVNRPTWHGANGSPVTESANLIGYAAGGTLPAAEGELMDIYLPLIATAPPVDDAPDHEWETALIKLLTLNPEQQRLELVRSDILMTVAQARVDDMARRNYFDHIDPDGYGANHYVITAGFALPDDYSRASDANNIESISAGHPTAADCWQVLTEKSPGHRAHLLGEHKFYRRQNRYGVGYAWQPASMYHHYYCFLLAEAT